MGVIQPHQNTLKDFKQQADIQKFNHSKGLLINPNQPKGLKTMTNFYQVTVILDPKSSIIYGQELVNHECHNLDNAIAHIRWLQADSSFYDCAKYHIYENGRKIRTFGKRKKQS
jgi:hypothetical protein